MGTFTVWCRNAPTQAPGSHQPASQQLLSVSNSAGCGPQVALEGQRLYEVMALAVLAGAAEPQAHEAGIDVVLFNPQNGATTPASCCCGSAAPAKTANANHFVQPLPSKATCGPAPAEFETGQELLVAG